VRYRGEEREITGTGNGPIEAFVNSLAMIGIEGASVEGFHEDALSAGSDAFAVAYVQVRGPGEGKAWGVGTDRSIAAAGVRAVLSAVNRRLSKE
jgi:2-isopropylmalate synthase